MGLQVLPYHTHTLTSDAHYATPRRSYTVTTRRVVHLHNMCAWLPFMWHLGEVWLRYIWVKFSLAAY